VDPQFAIDFKLLGLFFKMLFAFDAWVVVGLAC
jgi:hypothetical protein